MLCDVNQSNVFISVWFYFISFVKYHAHVLSFRFNWIYFVWIQYPLAFISVHSISMKMNNNKNTHTTRQIVPLIYRWLWNENYILYEWIELNLAHLCNNYRRKNKNQFPDKSFVFICVIAVYLGHCYMIMYQAHFLTYWFIFALIDFEIVEWIFRILCIQYFKQQTHNFNGLYWLSKVISMGYFSSKTWNSLHQ